MRLFHVVPVMLLVWGIQGCRSTSLPPISLLIAAESATVVVQTKGNYRTQAVSTPRWDFARALLKGASGFSRVATADAAVSSDATSRSCTLTLSDLPVGADYEMTIELVVRAPDGSERVLARETKGGITVSAGLNHVVFDRLVPAQTEALPSASGMPGAYVTSIASFGPAGRLAEPQGAAVDHQGRYVVVDYGTIRVLQNDNLGRLSSITVAGKLTSLGQGFQDGPGPSALFRNPSAIVRGPDGTFYVADGGNHAIRAVRIDSQMRATVSTVAGTGQPGLADGLGATAQFNNPRGLCVDAAGHILVADSANHRIREIRIDAEGVAHVSTLAGDGVQGARDGLASTAQFSAPAGVDVDASGHVYIGESSGRRVRRLSRPAGQPAVVSTVAGNAGNNDIDGQGTAASFSIIKSIRVGPDGSLFVLGATSLRRLTFDAAGVATVTTVAGGGATKTQDAPAASAYLNGSNQVALTPDGFPLVTGRSMLLKVAPNPAGQTWVSRVFGDYSQTGRVQADGPNDYSFSFTPNDLAFDEHGDLFVGTYDTMQIYKVPLNEPNTQPILIAGDGQAGYRDGAGPTAQFDNAQMMAYDKAHGLFVADYLNHCIRQITFGPDGGALVTTLIGEPTMAGHADGPAGVALFERPNCLLMGPDGNLYVADRWNNTIRMVSFGSGSPVVSTIAGKARVGSGAHVDGHVSVAEFNSPTGLAFDNEGNMLVSDTGNSCIRKIRLNAPGGPSVSTLVGRGRGYTDGPLSVAKFDTPWEIVFDHGRNRLYVQDLYRLRQIQFSPDGDSLVSTVAGSDSGYSDGPGAQAKFGKLAGMALDRAGNVYLADNENRLIRKVVIH